MIAQPFKQFFFIIVPTVYHWAVAITKGVDRRTQFVAETEYRTIIPTEFDAAAHARTLHNLPKTTIVLYEPPYSDTVPPGLQYWDHNGAHYIFCLTQVYSVTHKGQTVLGDRYRVGVWGFRRLSSGVTPPTWVHMV